MAVGGMVPASPLRRMVGTSTLAATAELYGDESGPCSACPPNSWLSAVLLRSGVRTLGMPAQHSRA